MRCANCGANIPEGMMICPDCCTEVQIVPDYNPLDDMLAREVRGSVAGTTRTINSDELRRYRRDRNQGYGSSTRVMGQGELDSIRSEYVRNQNLRRTNYIYTEQNTGRSQRATANLRNTTSIQTRNGMRNQATVRQDTEALRRKEAEERKRQQMLRKKKKRQQRIKYICAVLVFIAVVAGAAALMLYQNSYEGVVKKGYNSLSMEEYSAAEKYFNKAAAKDPKKAEAYVGLAEVYARQNDLDMAENIYLNAIDSYPENVELYKAGIEFYIETEQEDKISGLLDGCSELVLAELSEYVAKAPEFSLEEGSYEEVQQVSLSGDGKIYYTDDGTEPSEKSNLYKEPILLNEGTVIIKAICINEKGIPSLSTAKTYTVNLPIADAPAVSPSTGQYSSATQITIEVPEGYTAYYTTDGTTPTAASNLYTGPVEMPAGQTTFSAVLLNKTSGKLTNVTTRSYLLEY
ncbi:MAG: chitobiase/beta-hexosaminidase C-terminal domain-containing protein [Ruminococcus sp.]|nr:chitobiase/beta-hexosaminidase C-terminal domain-containing protein [Ruminococcus sp.]